MDGTLKRGPRRLIAVALKNWAFWLAIAAGFFLAGVWGVLTGIVAVVFLRRIIEYSRQEKQLERCLEQALPVSLCEPFRGAAFLCALAVSFCRDARFVVLQMKARFGKSCLRDNPDSDIHFWQLCSFAAARVKYLNADLLAEALVSCLKQTGDGDFVQSVLGVLDEAARVSSDPETAARQVLYFRNLLDYWRCTDERLRACAVLGVSPDDSPEKIRAAHRKLAARYHPDTAGAADNLKDSAAEDMFLRIQRAYEVLIR